MVYALKVVDIIFDNNFECYYLKLVPELEFLTRNLRFEEVNTHTNRRGSIPNTHIHIHIHIHILLD